ncbi:unnamed protein product [Clonostachys rosea f. rosea IK726]|uniref:Uncharacterized protein n=2 Tax=Bionectria ochroleuca TaxID=29856 RepID=A0A0B7K5D0_BIOOC|nr:unnamed protein product [Clonostachys rosea f. rosea IK726]
MHIGPSDMPGALARMPMRFGAFAVHGGLPQATSFLPPPLCCIAEGLGTEDWEAALRMLPSRSSSPICHDWSGPECDGPSTRSREADLSGPNEER